MKLSEIKGEKALDVLADIIDPAMEIASDKEIEIAVNGNASKLDIIKIVLRNHKKATIAIMAALDGKKPEEYEINVLTLPAKLIEMMNDPDLMSLFGLQSQTPTSSGSATENTEDEKT